MAKVFDTESVKVGDWISDYQGRCGTVIDIHFDETLNDKVFVVRTSYNLDLDIMSRNLSFVVPAE